MCELFGVSARKKIQVNNLLKEFFSHSEQHPHGWGMATFHKDEVWMEKEPVTAIKSCKIKEYLKNKIEVTNMFAHIRLATIGVMEYENCHPFMREDSFGRKWTLVHNGTLFNGYETNRYREVQQGKTDSERILYYFVDEIDKKQKVLGRALEPKERFDLLEKLVDSIAEGNKLNLLIYDGEQTYVHTNFKNSLHYLEKEEGVVFSTTPLSEEAWKPLPFTRLLVFQDGEKLWEGAPHNKEYIYNKDDYRYLLMESASL